MESFDKLSSQLQLMIINKLKLFDNINYQIYYKAGQALIKFCEEQPVQNEELLILAAQCLLQSCKEASQMSII